MPAASLLGSALASVDPCRISSVWHGPTTGFFLQRPTLQPLCCHNPDVRNIIQPGKKKILKLCSSFIENLFLIPVFVSVFHDLYHSTLFFTLSITLHLSSGCHAWIWISKWKSCIWQSFPDVPVWLQLVKLFLKTYFLSFMFFHTEL